jgi:hypothetical protein
VKSPTTQITKTIQAAWTEGSRQKLISFWSARRFRFSEASAASLIATRGHILWNLVSYDSTRLRAELSICSSEPDRIALMLTVHTAFQQITEWSRAFWDLEMETCESFLLCGDLRDVEWVEFMKAYRRAAIIWTLTLTLGGRRIPKTRAKTNA